MSRTDARPKGRRWLVRWVALGFPFLLGMVGGGVAFVSWCVHLDMATAEHLTTLDTLARDLEGGTARIAHRFRPPGNNDLWRRLVRWGHRVFIGDSDHGR